MGTSRRLNGDLGTERLGTSTYREGIRGVAGKNRSEQWLVRLSKEEGRPLALKCDAQSIVRRGRGFSPGHEPEHRHAGAPTLFVVGRDYHLGDLVWLTAVLREYRAQCRPAHLELALPDRPISRILEPSALIDSVSYDRPRDARVRFRQKHGARSVVHDLRAVPLGWRMTRRWRDRLPWRYYRDLWFEPRGQWLATFLGLGRMTDYRPTLQSRAADGDEPTGAIELGPSRPFVVLAPHIGTYSVPVSGAVWRRLKQWNRGRWTELSDLLREKGYGVVTLAAHGHRPVPGTQAQIGADIREVVATVRNAAALVTMESGLWFVAAAVKTPFVIVPWWLPKSIGWPAAMNVPHVLIRDRRAQATTVFERMQGMVGTERSSIMEPAVVA